MKKLNCLSLIIPAAVLMLGCKGSDAEASGKKPTQTAAQSEAKPQPKKSEKKSSTDKKAPGDAKHSPDKYTVKLNTTKGEILIDVTRAWSPNGADRFYSLVESGYYTDIAFFRVIEGFMAQAGISGDPAENTRWRNAGIKDDPVKESNKRGMVTFAMSGRPDSRTTQFFINFKDNTNLDGMGFAPFGKVRDMKIVDTLYKGYGEGAPRGRGPSQGRMQREGNAYLKKEFPELDYILSAEIVK